MYIYILVCCLTLLSLSLLFNIFDFLDFEFDIDFLDIEFDGFDLQFLPISFKPICMGLIVFSSLCLSFGDTGVLFWINALLGYLTSVLVQFGINYLKRYEKPVKSEKVLIGKTAKVLDSIGENGSGTIKIERLNDSSIVLTAKVIDGKYLAQNELVTVLEVKDGVAIVSKKGELVDFSQLI